MGKKGNLLSEGQVRKFMKLANLEAITPGFVHGLNERGGRAGDEDDEPGEKGREDFTGKKEKAGADKRKGAEKRGAEGTRAKTKGHGDVDYVDESHGRGRGEGPGGYGKPDQNARLAEQEDDDWDVEDAEDDLEHAEDLDIDAEEDLGDVGLGGEEDLGPAEGGQQVSVDDFLAALEVALEEVLGDEVEVDQEEDVEVEDELELPLGGEEELGVGLEVEEEPALQEMINKITRRVAKRIVKEALQGKK